MKKLIFFFALFGALVIGYAYYLNNPALKFLPKFPSFSTQGASARINDQQFSLYVARTPEEITKGLAGFNSLAQNSGMVFPFDHPDYFMFWMKDINIPIDIIYLRDNKIVTIYPNMQPSKDSKTWQIVRPLVPSDTVIEINAGLSQKYQFKVGDVIQLAL